MKSALFIFLFSLFFGGLYGQDKKPKKSKKSTTNTSRATRSTTAVDSNQFVSNAVDSFKRTLRYTPGRPYYVADSVNASTVSIPGKSSQTAARTDTFPDRTTQNVKVTAQGINLTGTQPVRNIPVSPSMERNRADINQLPMNQNRKNSISTMNSPQVNTLNNYQMAPPPENWGFAMEDNPWGRNTVGVSQWTPDSKIYNNFLRDFPTAGNAMWTPDRRDTLKAVVVYQNGVNWSSSTYDAGGLRTETRTQLSIYDLPDPVQFYMGKQNNDYKIQQLLRINKPLEGDQYLIVFNTGRQVFISNQGIEIPSK